MLNFKRDLRSAAQTMVKPVRALHQKNRGNLDNMNMITLLKEMKAQMIYTNDTILKLNSQFSNPILTRQEANNDIEHKAIKNSLSSEFFSAATKIKKATKIAGKRRCLGISWTNTDDANLMATALRSYLKSHKNDEEPRSLVDVAQVSKSALNRYHIVYNKIASSADSETVMKMDPDGIVQHASLVRMLSNQRAIAR
jgi:hypothetical protein